MSEFSGLWLTVSISVVFLCAIGIGFQYYRKRRSRADVLPHFEQVDDKNSQSQREKKHNIQDDKQEDTLPNTTDDEEGWTAMFSTPVYAVGEMFSSLVSSMPNDDHPKTITTTSTTPLPLFNFGGEDVKKTETAIPTSPTDKYIGGATSFENSPCVKKAIENVASHRISKKSRRRRGDRKQVNKSPDNYESVLNTFGVLQVNEAGKSVHQSATETWGQAIRSFSLFSEKEKEIVANSAQQSEDSGSEKANVGVEKDAGE